MRSVRNYRSLLSAVSYSRRLSKATSRACLEMLEGRVMLSTVVVNTIADSTDPLGCATVSLRDAVAAANSSAAPTTITFDPTVFATAQTITIGGSPLTLSNTSQATTITGPAAGVTVFGNGTATAFAINTNVTANLSGLTVRNNVAGNDITNAGNLTLNDDSFSLAGIDNTATLDMTNSTVSAFVADGIVNGNVATMTLGNITITGTGASGNSTNGIYNQGNATLNQVSISQVATAISNSGNLTGGNVTISGNLTDGGINNGDGGNLTLTDSTISGSTIVGNSTYGGGIVNYSYAKLVDDTIYGNTLSGNGTDGGGLCNLGNATLIGDTIAGNTLTNGYGYGGGIYNNGNLTMTDSTVADNSVAAGNISKTGGGGIFNDSGGTVALADDTIADNSVSGTAGGGGGIINVGNAANFTIANTIVSGDTVPNNNGPDVAGNITSQGHNLIGVVDGNSSGWIASDLTGNVATPLNAQLGGLAHNGGPTDTLLPQTGSPALAAGNTSLIPSGITTDQRGLSRIVNSAVDIGAVEVQTITTISVTPPANQIANMFHSQSFTLGSFTETGATGPYSVDVNWGDGTTDTIIGNVAAAGTIPATAHTYLSTGNDTVSITITDAGNHTSNTATFIVDAARITAVAPGSEISNQGVGQLFNVGSFSTDNTTAPFTATINWGDGSAITTIGNISAAGNISQPTHTYTTLGVHLVNVIVTDSAGHTSNTAVFTVDNAAVTITAPPNQSSTPGQSHVFNLGNFTATPSEPPFTITINWGDGSGNTTIGNLTNTGAIPPTAHTYTNPGVQVVTVTVTDSTGHSSNITFTVDDAAITATAAAGQTATAGQSQVLNIGNFTAVPPEGPFTATINWGDGSGNTTISNIATPGAIPATAHTYTAAGNDTVTITVTDADGQTSNSPTLVVTVAPAPASIAGTVYTDTNDTGVYSPTDPGLANVTVYLDTNNNGQLDAGETSVTTDANGHYFFGNLTAATYVVREVAPSGDVLTSPAAGDISLTLSAGQTVSNQIFLDAPRNSAVEQPVYRLYSPVTLDHLFTSDLNEYDTLKSEVGLWNDEGVAYYDYSAPATVDGVTDEPLYRLYNPTTKQHLWTADTNEQTVLASEAWFEEGIAGYIFPTAVAGTAPNALYRLNMPATPAHADLHLWTTSVNEYDTLQTVGWAFEDVAGYVL